MDKPLISVIVPVYKTEKYLGECVESILKQTYTNLEVILVDDGSPDNCPAICDAYAAKDSRVKVIHKPNGGVSSARNAGLDIAQGEYILFVDSDDYHLEDSLEKICAALEQEKPDVLCFGTRKETPTGSTDVCSEYYAGPITEELLLSLAYAGIVFSDSATVDVSVFNKAYKTAIIKSAGLVFDSTLRIAEDITFNVQYFCRCNSIVCLDAVLYFYRNNLASAIHVDKGFAEKGMERSVYFLSHIQKALEQRISKDKLYPIAKNRYNRLVIDACSKNHQRGWSYTERHKFIKNCVEWLKQYAEEYDVSLREVTPFGKKARLENFLVSNKCVILLDCYTGVMDWYHKKRK